MNVIVGAVFVLAALFLPTRAMVIIVIGAAVAQSLAIALRSASYRNALKSRSV